MAAAAVAAAQGCGANQGLGDLSPSCTKLVILLRKVIISYLPIAVGFKPGVCLPLGLNMRRVALIVVLVETLEGHLFRHCCAGSEPV